jgi:hypothetical protein
MNSRHGGQEKPSVVHRQLSLNPTKDPPKKANPIPTRMIREMRSSRKIGARRATHKGEVHTRTTELATVVYSRDVIQVAKCRAKKAPESKAYFHSLNWRVKISSRCRRSTKGAKNKTAKPSRKAATVKEEAYSCAKRMRIDAVETAMIPTGKARKGGIKGERSSIIGLSHAG